MPTPPKMMQYHAIFTLPQIVQTDTIARVGKKPLAGGVAWHSSETPVKD
jgi:hypothetical protein